MSPAAFISRHSHSLKQFVSFGLVGGSGVLVNLAVYALANNVGHHFLHVGYNDPVANVFGPFHLRYVHLYNIVAFVFAVTWNFVLNRYWTFRHEGQGQKAPFLKEYGPFFLTGLIANFGTLLILTLLTNPTSPLYLPKPFFTDDGPLWTKRPYWGQAIAIVCTMPINFVVNKLWTFRAVRRRHAAKVAG